VDDVITQAVLLLFGGALAGGVLGAAFGAWRGRRGADGMVAGLALGLSVFAACTVFGAARVGLVAWQQQRGMVAAEGRLVDFVEQTDTDASTRRTTTVRAPRVEFTSADGRRHVIQGLGGSQGDKRPGDPVPVLYPPQDPARGLVADFQNLWGGFWALSGFAGFGLLSALFFVAQARADARARRPASRASSRRGAASATASRRGAAPASRIGAAWAAWRIAHGERWRASFNAAAGLTFLAALLYPAIGPGDHLERSVAVSFAGVATAMVCYGAAAVFGKDGASGQTLGILGILAAGFAFFAFGLWQLSTP
jgi:hypothetical protein